MAGHRITLRGPWNVTHPLPGVAEQRTLPQSWQELFGPSRGIARFERVFHRPTNLDSDEAVWLVLTEVRGAGQVTVNGHQLGEWTTATDSPRFDLTPHLQPTNRLQIDLEIAVTPDSPPAGLHHPVVLEISRSQPHL